MCIFLNLSNHCHICLNWVGVRSSCPPVGSAALVGLSSALSPIRSFPGHTVRDTTDLQDSSLRLFLPLSASVGSLKYKACFHACDAGAFSSYIISSDNDDHPTAEPLSPL